MTDKPRAGREARASDDDASNQESSGDSDDTPLFMKDRDEPLFREGGGLWNDLNLCCSFGSSPVLIDTSGNYVVFEIALNGGHVATNLTPDRAEQAAEALMEGAEQVRESKQPVHADGGTKVDDLDALTDAEREVYEACVDGDTGPREYARDTDRAPGTVGNLLRRARRKLRGETA